MKILISWLAKNNDFGENGVNDNGPTINFYKHFFEYDRHLLLSTAKGDDTYAEQLASRLRVLYPDAAAKLEVCYMAVDDVIDIPQIKAKVETLLLQHGNDDIDIFYSPGTSAMQVAWFICHTTLGLRTRLLQVRPANRSRTRQPELIVIDVAFSATPMSAVIFEDSLSKSTKPQGHLLVPSIQLVYDKAELVALTDKVTTLIIGGSGTGKEQLARHIHERSGRSGSPFIAINCSAFSDQLLESRLFGYKKGAFTDAAKDTSGLFEAANGGTIFLDEIGDISSYMQQSLLRVIQEQEILPLGANIPVKINVRVIAATNRDLPDACRQERFRWDLYYRLAVAELVLPNMADLHASEREAFITYFLKAKKAELRKSRLLKLSKEAHAALLAYPFPGNIRELENLIAQLYVFHEEFITLTDLPMRIQKPTAEFSLRWQDVEKVLIEKVMRLTNGNKRQACDLLGYGSINTLQKKLKLYNLENFNNASNTKRD